MRGGRSFYPTLCFALFLRVVALTSPVVLAEDNLPVAADGGVVFLPWRCGAYVALPEREQIRRGLEAAANFGGNGLHFGGNGLRLRGGTVFFSAIRRRPGSVQIIIGRGRGGGDGDDVNDFISTSGGRGVSALVRGRGGRGGGDGDDVNNDISTSGGRGASALLMSTSRGSGSGIPTTSDADSSSSRTLRAEGEEQQQQQQQGTQPAVAATAADAKLFPRLRAELEEEEEEGGAGDGGNSSDSSSSVDDFLSAILFSAPRGLIAMSQSPFLDDPRKLLLARTRGVRAMGDRTPSWLSRSGRQEKDKEEDGSISEREVVTTTAAAAAAAEAAARGLSSSKNEAGEVSVPVVDRDLLPVGIAEEEDGDTSSSSSSGRDGDDDASPFWQGGFVGNDLSILSSKVLFRLPEVYSWRPRDADREGGAGDEEEEGMVFRDVLLFPRRGEEEQQHEEEEEEVGAGVVGILRCVKGWWSQLSSWAVGVGRSMRETALQYRSSVEDGAFFALATAVPMALLLLIVHVVARCTYSDEEEEEGEEEEEDDDDDDDEGGKQQGSRTVVIVTANTVGNDDVRTPLLDNRLYRGEEPSSDADEDMMSKLEATVVDYNPPNPADMTRGV